MLTFRKAARAVRKLQFPLSLREGWAKKHMNSWDLVAVLAEEWERRKRMLTGLALSLAMYGSWYAVNFLHTRGIIIIADEWQSFGERALLVWMFFSIGGMLSFSLYYFIPMSEPSALGKVNEAKKLLRALDTLLKAVEAPSIESLPQDDERLRAFVESRLLQQAGHKLAAELGVLPTANSLFYGEAQRAQKRLKHTYESAQPFDLVQEQPLTAYEERALHLLAKKRATATALVRPAAEA